MDFKKATNMKTITQTGKPQILLYGMIGRGGIQRDHSKVPTQRDKIL